MHTKFSKRIMAFVLGCALLMPVAASANTLEETPSAVAMTGDALFVRPVMFVTTILGGGIFIVSSPFAALGGNIDESWDVLVKEPFKTTFVRCLGCTKNGRKTDVETLPEAEAE